MEVQQQLFALLYSELHRIASRELRRHAPGLSATTLLHEAYLSLSEKDASLFPDRAHFISYAARVMRGLVIDFARNRRALKRGGEFHITTDAEQYGKTALSRTESLARGADTSADVGEALLLLAKVRIAQGSASEAQPLLARAVRCLESALDQQHPLAVEARQLLAA